MATRNDIPRVWALFKLYRPNFSGAAIQGHEVLRRLVRDGFSVTVLAAGIQAARQLRGREIDLDGVTVCYLPVTDHQGWGFLERFRLLWKVQAYLTSLARSLTLAVNSAWLLHRNGREGDIVQLYSCNVFSFLPVWVARARRMHPVIRMTLLGSPDDPGSFQGGIRNSLRVLKLEAFRQSEVIVGISSALRDNCRTAGLDPDAVKLIPNGVDLHYFHPLTRAQQLNLRQALHLRADHRYIVFVGSAHARKGIDVLIAAFIQVASELKDVELLIVGPCDFTDLSRHDPQQQGLVTKLKYELENERLASRVHWAGDVDNVSAYLQVADIFCLPTRREGFGTVIAEAMAVGLPVVVSKLEGVTTDIVRAEAEGVLIDGHDPAEYAEALITILNDRDRARRMGECARARAVSDFDISTTARRYAELYARLASVPQN